MSLNLKTTWYNGCMAAHILNGAKKAVSILESLDAQEKPFKKKLISIVVGNDASSHFFADLKIKRAKQLGLLAEKSVFEENLEQSKIIDSIQTFNDDPTVSGIVVQLPLPNPLHRHAILSAVSTIKDVDCLNPQNVGSLLEGTYSFISPVVLAVLDQISETNIFAPQKIPYLGHTFTVPNLTGIPIAILGGGLLVGKPLCSFLINRGASAQILNEHTNNIGSYTKLAKIVITGTNSHDVLSSTDIKDGTVLIDVGNDIDKRTFIDREIFFSTNPGGIGPLTVAYLLFNTFYNPNI